MLQHVSAHLILPLCPPLLTLTPQPLYHRRLEATYEIREDIADVLQRVGAFHDEDDNVRFAGWSRMALPLNTFRVTEVRREGWDGCGRGVKWQGRRVAHGTTAQHLQGHRGA